MEPVKFSFTPTKQDYVRTTRLTTLRPLPTRLGIGALTLILALMICSSLISVPNAPVENRDSAIIFGIGYPLVCLLGYATILLGLLVVNPMIVGNMVRKNERLRAPVAWEMSDENIVIRSGDFAETKQDWGMFREAAALKDYYLLGYIINKRAYQFIPKRAFESPEHEAAFRAMVEAHLGAIKK